MPATCEKCGKQKMVPVDLRECEDVLVQLHYGNDVSTELRCLYCRHVQTSDDPYEVGHAFEWHEAITSFVRSELAAEKAKVERLKEGRW